MKSDVFLFCDFSIDNTTDNILLKFKKKCPSLCSGLFKSALTTKDIYFVGLLEDKVVIFDDTKFSQNKKVAFYAYDEVVDAYINKYRYIM